MNELNYIGLIIFVLALAGAFLNWDKKISKISLLWCIYSFVILCLIGWGTAENSLILYALYFSWSFYILIFLLVVKLEELTRIKFLVPVIFFAGLYVFARFNFPAIMELVNFAVKNYPLIW